MPITVTITADKLKELLAEREAARALREEQEPIRGALRLVTAERDLAEERLRAYRRELLCAKSEALGLDQLRLFNEAKALSANRSAARQDLQRRQLASIRAEGVVTANRSIPISHARCCDMISTRLSASARTTATRS
jgi:hypothetical protein